MAIQQRNEEMVNLLKADFVAKSDEVFMWAFLTSMYSMLPGVAAFWPMSGVSKDDAVYFSANGNYNMTSENMTIGGNVQTAWGRPWDLRDYAAGAPGATGYVSVMINGNLYKLLASNV